MRTRLRARRALGIAAAAAIAGVVHASAPPGQYVTFGRLDRCILDQQTKLTWSRTALVAPGGATTFSFADAQAKCPAVLGPGWRVPTVNELLTLVDEVPHTEIDLAQRAIDANAFPAAPVTNPYWTSSGVANDPLRARAVDFHDGSTLTESVSQPNYVRCVMVTPATPPAACQTP